MSIELKPIGYVQTEATELPRHWSVSEVEGWLVIDPQYQAGLKDIEPGQGRGLRGLGNQPGWHPP